MLGYSREEFLQRKLWEVGAFKDVQASKDAFLALQKAKYIRYKDLPLRAKTGQVIQVEFVSNVYQAGDQNVIQCNIRDITERKQAQDALVRSEASLREQSARDYLTGLYNRRYLEETLDRELVRATRAGLAVGVIILDLDHLKSHNDIAGHAAGDAVLSGVGQLLLETFRREDIPARYGGDEFMVVLPGASARTTRRRADRLCEKACALRIQFEGQTLAPISLSIGVATFPENGSTREALFMAADAALYRAKDEGRGRVVAAK